MLNRFVCNVLDFDFVIICKVCVINGKFTALNLIGHVFAVYGYSINLITFIGVNRVSVTFALFEETGFTVLCAELSALAVNRCVNRLIGHFVCVYGNYHIRREAGYSCDDAESGNDAGNLFDFVSIGFFDMLTVIKLESYALVVGTVALGEAEHYLNVTSVGNYRVLVTDLKTDIVGLALCKLLFTDNVVITAENFVLHVVKGGIVIP